MAETTPYVKQTWTDGASSASAARLTVIEEGIRASHEQPAARVYHNTTQSHTTTGTYQAVTFNSERYDTAFGSASTQHDTGVNPTRLTCRYAGVYVCGGGLSFAANVTGVRALKIRLNGGTDIVVGPVVSAAVDGSGNLFVSTAYQLAVNDYLELLTYQTSGGALNIASSIAITPEFWFNRVG